MKQLLIFEELTGQIKTPKEIFELAKAVEIDHEREHFILLHFNNALQLLKSEVLFIGGIASADCDLRIILKHLLLSGAVKFAIAHNHPSGNLKPSPADISFINRVNSATNILEIDLIDSIIFSQTEFYSTFG